MEKCVKLVKKKQPIPTEVLCDLQDFIQMIADKDVQSFALCCVDRTGGLHALHYGGEDFHKINAAVDFLSARVKG